MAIGSPYLFDLVDFRSTAYLKASTGQRSFRLTRTLPRCC
jgi:hypothetical protein